MAESKATKRQQVNILVVDDHQLVRDGLKVMLSSLNKFYQFKVFEAESGHDALSKIRGLQIDLVIMDYQMPGLTGAETSCRLLDIDPHIKILALSNYDELPYVQSMIDAGVKGYVLKNIDPSEMQNAIRTILSGKSYFCSAVAVKLIGIENNNHSEGAIDILTDRELEILQMIALELTNEEIAQKLYISKRTVDAHRQNISNKLQVKNSIGLIKAAYKLNLVK